MARRAGFSDWLELPDWKKLAPTQSNLARAAGMERLLSLPLRGTAPDVTTNNAPVGNATRCRGVVPDVITYSAANSACEKASGLAGQVPNVVTYDALILCCEDGIGATRPGATTALLVGGSALCSALLAPTMGMCGRARVRFADASRLSSE